MNWLILSNPKEIAKNISSVISTRDKNAQVSCHALTKAEIKKWSSSLSTFTNIVVCAKSEDLSDDSIARSLFSLAGYCTAAKITMFTNLKELEANCVGTVEFIHVFKNEKQIEDDINSNYIYLLDAATKKQASTTLLNLGIPFTPNCFGMYITKGKFEICRNFVAAGMDVNVKDDEGTSMLNLAVRAEHEELVSWLIENGADINSVSEDRGYTPVMDAVWRGNKDITSLLISKGADLNTINKEGQSNLVLAVGANNLPIVELLAKNGADADVKDAMGMSAYGYAKLFKKEDILAVLEPYHKGE